jgi:hypothetical protein
MSLLNCAKNFRPYQQVWVRWVTWSPGFISDYLMVAQKCVYTYKQSKKAARTDFVHTAQCCQIAI